VTSLRTGNPLVGRRHACEERDMAKFLHFAPVNRVGRIVSRGLRASRREENACGVYAVPCVGFPRATTNVWRHTLKGCGQKTRLATIIFEIADEELVHAFATFQDNFAGNRDLVSARAAEDLGHRMARQHAVEAEYPEDQSPSYHFGDEFEVVVLRSIEKGEVVRVIGPGKARKAKSARLRQKAEDRKYFSSVLAGTED
jgi:hypothetical protein